jgi:uncharacterized cofD-like protein
MKRGSKIVVIGGGTGIYSVLSGLKKYPVDLTAVVSMADDGGSTGVLREEFGMLPPGDVRRVLVALSSHQEDLCNLFNYRFEKGNLKGHNFGNLLITALSKMNNDNFEKAITVTSKILNIKGQVIPITLDKTKLYARLENGKLISGESNIDIPKHNGELKIDKVYLKPRCIINPKAKQVIKNADFIIVGPGDLYTSIIPNLLVNRVVDEIKKADGKKIYICNLMTKFGETNRFTAKKFVFEVENYLGEGVLDFVLVNNKMPERKTILKYRKEKANMVRYQKKDFQNKSFKLIESNFLRSKNFIRHDPQKIAKVLYSLR